MSCRLSTQTYTTSHSYDGQVRGYNRICKGGLITCRRPTILSPADVSTSMPRGFHLRYFQTDDCISSAWDWPSRTRLLWNACDHGLRWKWRSTKLSPWWYHGNFLLQLRLSNKRLSWSQIPLSQYEAKKEITTSSHQTSRSFFGLSGGISCITLMSRKLKN